MKETGAKDPTAGKDEASLLLDDQMCFALYAAQRALTNRYRPLLEAFDLTYPQYLVMLVLWEHGALPIKALGKFLQLDYGTLTPLLKRLQTHGLVR
ncbi:MarR family winged helix-turn-helix transcriptional regulator, partial [Streptomyces fagopyri]